MVVRRAKALGSTSDMRALPDATDPGLTRLVPGDPATAPGRRSHPPGGRVGARLRRPSCLADAGSARPQPWLPPEEFGQALAGRGQDDAVLRP